jgi:hypothetical protein
MISRTRDLNDDKTDAGNVRSCFVALCDTVTVHVIACLYLFKVHRVNHVVCYFAIEVGETMTADSEGDGGHISNKKRRPEWVAFGVCGVLSFMPPFSGVFDFGVCYANK